MSINGDVTINGQPCFRGIFVRPYQGIWAIDAQMDSDEVPSGSVVLNLMGRELRGTVEHAPNDVGQVLAGDSGGIKHLRIVAGAGGLQTRVQPKSYDQGALVGQVLADLLAMSGSTDETRDRQAADIDPDLLAKVLPQWSWTAGPLMGALQQLAAAVGAIVRAKDDGTIWIGLPNPQAITAPELVLLDIAPESGQATYGLDESSLDVDQIIDGLTLRQVVYEWEPGALRALVTYAPGPTTALFQLFGLWLRRAGIDFLRPQPGRTKQQSASGTIEVQPDDAANYAPYRRAALRYGLPDTTCQVNSGSRCAVGYEAGNPQFPAVLNWSSQSTAQKIKIGVSAAGPLPGTQPTLKGTSFRSAQSTMHAGEAASLIAAAVALGIAGTADLVAVAPLSAAQLVLAANALGAGSGMAKYIQDFEGTASASGNFLTSIAELG